MNKRINDKGYYWMGLVRRLEQEIYLRQKKIITKEKEERR
jgi:hypothetical protein